MAAEHRRRIPAQRTQERLRTARGAERGERHREVDRLREDDLRKGWLRVGHGKSAGGMVAASPGPSGSSAQGLNMM